jgi:hypothetical protein
MARPTARPSQSWRTFLANHRQQIAAADFFVVPTATCRLLFVLVILAHDRRRVANSPGARQKMRLSHDRSPHQLMARSRPFPISVACTIVTTPRPQTHDVRPLPEPAAIANGSGCAPQTFPSCS